MKKPFKPYIFNVRDSYYSETEGAVRYFVDKLGLEKIAVMYQQDSFGLAVLSGARLALERRGKDTVAIDTYLRGTTDVEEAMETIKLSGAEVVIMGGLYTPLAKFMRISNEAGFRPYFNAVSFVGAEAFYKEIVEVEKVDPSEYSKIMVTQVVPSPFLEGLPGVKDL